MQSLNEYLTTANQGATFVAIGIGIYVLYRVVEGTELGLKYVNELVDKAQVSVDDTVAKGFGIVTDDLKSRVDDVEGRRNDLIQEDLEKLKRSGYEEYLKRSGSASNAVSYSDFWKDKTSQLAIFKSTATQDAWTAIPETPAEKSYETAIAKHEVIEEMFTDVPKKAAVVLGGPQNAAVLTSQGQMSYIGGRRSVIDECLIS